MHMRKQILGNPAPYVEVRAAAISVGLDPGGSECRALVDVLLRAGYLRGCADRRVANVSNRGEAAV
jgi:hypothetical protein